MRSTISAISSPNRLATTAVTAGISSTAPATSPTPSANATIQPSTASGPCAHDPSVASSQPMPVPDSHPSSRNNTIASTTSSATASPTDFNSTARNGGVNIWSRAFNTAASIAPLSAEPLR